MNNNNFFKYIFAAVVVFLIGYTAYIIFQNNTKGEEASLDHTSTLTNIQTDLRFAIAELDRFNPLTSNNRNVQEITKIIYDPLVTLNANYKLEYCLAEEIAKTDDITYVVKLRKGVLWEDRSNFTAEDVKYTIDLIKSGISPVYSENVKYILDAQIIDSTTIKIILTQPVAFFEYNLTFPIMCKNYYDGEDFAVSEKLPIGTGMFRISEASTNVIKLVPNEYYWNTSRKPMATEININLYGTIGEVYTAFKNGEIDILSIKINNVEDYIGTLGYKKIEFKSRNYDFIAFNTASELLSDPIVRQALSLAVDRNSLVGNLGEGYIASNFSLDFGSWLYTKDLNSQIDTEKASQILMNAGWERTANTWQKRDESGTRTLNFRLVVNSEDAVRTRVAEIIRDQFASFGVQVNIDYLPYNDYAEAINTGNYEAAITGIRVGFSPSLNTFFGSGNIANYNNEEVLEIINAVSNTTEDNVLYEKYNRLYDIYVEEAPYIGLYRNTETIIYNQSLVNNITANYFNIYHNIEKWYRQ